MSVNFDRLLNNEFQIHIVCYADYASNTSGVAKVPQRCLLGQKTVKLSQQVYCFNALGIVLYEIIKIGIAFFFCECIFH